MYSFPRLPRYFPVQFIEMYGTNGIYCQLVSLCMGLRRPSQQVPPVVTPACSPVALENSKGNSRAKAIVTNWNVKSEASECLLPTSPSARGAEWLVPLEMLVHPVKCFISKSNRGKRAARSLSWKENENTGASSSNTSIMRRCTNIAPTACWPELTLLIGEKNYISLRIKKK